MGRTLGWNERLLGNQIAPFVSINRCGTSEQVTRGDGAALFISGIGEFGRGAGDETTTTEIHVCWVPVSSQAID
jgi:hypothetical protein